MFYLLYSLDTREAGFTVSNLWDIIFTENCDHGKIFLKLSGTLLEGFSVVFSKTALFSCDHVGGH
jgi:hypothetical protein